MKKMNKMDRRAFVRQSGLMLAGATLPTFISAQSKQTLGVALVGLGYYSRDVLAPALQLTNHCKLAGIVTGSPDKIPVWQEKYRIADRNVYNYESMADIANNDDIDVIYIVLPPGLHAEYTIKAADTGKHVWCEKPMAPSAAECLAMINACRRNRVALTIGYRMQHEPNTRTIMEYARSRPFGAIKEIQVEAGYRENRTDHWKQMKSLGGGCMYDMGVYPLNAARYTMGAEPIAVTARHEVTRPEIYHEVDETTFFDLEFPGGAMAHCKTSFAEGVNFLRVDCDHGWYGLKPFSAYSGVTGETSAGTLLNLPIENEQATQMDNDAMAIINSTEVLVPGEEGLKDIAIVEAIYKSAATGARILL